MVKRISGESNEGPYPTNETGLMFSSHTGSMPGEPTLYNLALIRRVGEWQIVCGGSIPTGRALSDYPSRRNSPLQVGRQGSFVPKANLFPKG